MRTLLIILLLLPTLGLSETFEASFPCDKAGTNVEKLICSNEKLAISDSSLANKYKRALFLTQGESDLMQKIKSSQKKWLIKTRDICTDVACIQNAYNERNNYLELYNYEGVRYYFKFEGRKRSVTFYDYKYTNFRNASFENGLSKSKYKDYKLLNCSMLSKQNLTRYNDKYAGLCELEAANKEIKKSLICNDEMAGVFEIKEQKNDINFLELSKFLYAHCRP